MGKRQKAEMLGLVQRIIQAYNDEKLTFEAIEQMLRDEGYDISREAIRRTVKSNKQIASELEKTRTETVALIDAIRDNPNTDTNEAAVDWLITKSFEYIKTIENVNFKDLPEMSTFMNSITRMKGQLVKQRMDYNKVFEKVKQMVIADLQKALEDWPELYQQLFTIVTNLEAPDVG
ncbi:phage protein Gp27 family protein [Parasphaerochaeta coccoides]|uniref:DUF3486 family protein n=1 Tax=Parasphaerochaeta coccoides (strain ATCC BAA-1237 / DSM 17374 / SPN1) TaxID=760011 RepID=F4GHE4_PARC1|nr:phage protein Gp27 family protein [Parasphaerochaeta coccoides]AEC02043.1 hypothetical protein Spico_0819 [Parasphaerochaeta coccoides DSM 17374]